MPAPKNKKRYEEWKLRVGQASKDNWKNRERLDEKTAIENIRKILSNSDRDELIKIAGSKKKCIKLNLKKELHYFKDSPYKLIDSSFQEKNIKPWHLPKAPNGTWKGEKGKRNAVEALKELLSNLSYHSDEELLSVSTKLLQKNGFDGALKTFNYSAVKLVQAAYPERCFQEFRFKNVPKHYWKNEENVKKAIRWVVEERLRIIPTKESLGLITIDEIVINIGAGIMDFYNKNELINIAYPSLKMEKSDYKNKRDYWSKEEAKKKTRKLLLDILKWTKDEEFYEISHNHFKENGLDGMLVQVFNHSPVLAVCGSFQERNLKIFLFKNVPKKYYSGEIGLAHGKEATLWLCKEKLGCKSKEDVLLIQKKHFEIYGLDSMLTHVFGSSPSKAVIFAFKDEYYIREYEFAKKRQSLWREGTASIATAKELIRSNALNHGFNTRKKISCITQNDVNRWHLGAAIREVFKNSLSSAIAISFPEYDYAKKELECINKGETLLGDMLEEILGKQLLRKVRPEFLKCREYTKGLELDCYYPQHKISFEYQGIQHSIFSNYFHKGDHKNFEKQKERDKKKEELCKKEGVILIKFYENEKLSEQLIVRRIRESGVDIHSFGKFFKLSTRNN